MSELKGTIEFTHDIKEGTVEVWKTGCLCSPLALSRHVYPSHMCVYGGSLWLRDHNKDFWKLDGKYRSLYRVKQDLPLCETWEEIEVLMELWEKES
jgi:hypothetical protein